MSIVSLTQFMRVQTRGGTPSVIHTFQNSVIGSSIVFDGWGHSYLSFAYQGGVMNRSGDAVEATLTLASNAIALERVENIVQKRMTIIVTTCQMSATFSNPKEINREVWVATGAGYDNTAIEVKLSSPIDAVDSNVPNIYLTQNNVGRLPVTGQLSNY